MDVQYSSTQYSIARLSSRATGSLQKYRRREDISLNFILMNYLQDDLSGEPNAIGHLGIFRTSVERVVVSHPVHRCFDDGYSSSARRIQGKVARPRGPHHNPDRNSPWFLLCSPLKRRSFQHALFDCLTSSGTNLSHTCPHFLSKTAT